MDLSEAGVNYLAHMWTDDVLKSTDERKETCPFPFISYILPTTRSRGSMSSRQPPNQEVQQPPRTMFANYDAESYTAADQEIVSQTLIELGFISKIVTRVPGNPLPRPVQVEDALSMKLPDGTFVQWRQEESSYPTAIIEEVWRKSLVKIRARIEEVNLGRTDFRIADVRDIDTGHGTIVVLCNSKFDNLLALDEHIERVHMGDLGLRSLPAAVRVDGSGIQLIQQPADVRPALSLIHI